MIAIFQRKNATQIEIKNIQKLREKIGDLDFLQQENIAIEYIDFGKDDYLNNHYKFGDKNGLSLFVKNQMIDLKGFQECIEKESFDFELIKDFLHTKIKGISIEIYSLENLDQILHNHTIIGLFIGNKGKQFKDFFELAQSNIDFYFYHTFNREILKDLEQKFNKQIPYNSFVIIRHDDLINDYDHSSVVIFSEFNQPNLLNKFFNFERHPKLRDSSFYSSTLQDIIWKDHKVFLYVKGVKIDQNHFQAFLNAVKSIPKTFIFKVVEMGSNDWRHINQLLEYEKDQIESDSVYILYANEDKKIKAEQFHGFLEKQKLIKFAQKYERFDPIDFEENINGEL